MFIFGCFFCLQFISPLVTFVLSIDGYFRSVLSVAMIAELILRMYVCIYGIYVNFPNSVALENEETEM